MSLKTTAFGFPKIGPNREFKKSLELFWKNSISKDELFIQLDEVDTDRQKIYLESSLDIIPSNEFSYYDFMLDMSAMLGVIPDRFKHIEDDLRLYFAMARGEKDIPACEMTKWFNTNYHYIVPEITQDFNLTANRPLYSYRAAREKLGMETKPVMIGPYTYIYMSKIIELDSSIGKERLVKAKESSSFREIIRSVSRIYNKILRELDDECVALVQLDEPALTLDMSDSDVDILIEAYEILTGGLKSLKIHLQTYYESISHYQKIVYRLPVDGIGLDFTENETNLNLLRKYGFPENKVIIAGIVSGRNPWKVDYREAMKMFDEIKKYIPLDRIILSNAAPLFHLPYSLEPEKGNMNPNVINLLSFAKERLNELKILKEIINNDEKIPHQDLETTRGLFKNNTVQAKLEEFRQKSSFREPFSKRHTLQDELLALPLFPTTTIGSFPQIGEIRKKRADFVGGRITKEEYDEFIRSHIRALIKLQEEIGLDVLVHGEFERTDMVEFFAEKLCGFAITRNGWVQSYGSRCVRPPIIYGDVSRLKPMTVDETQYAQSLTGKPVKGMLTGPVTMVNWSFCRRDIPKEDAAFQIAMVLNDELKDLENAGITIIQIDEPAFREGLPLKQEKQKDYLTWAVNAFKIACAEVKPQTQIHTHMCYSEFNEIINYIYDMDSDVISIEASRSKGEILQAFEKFNYSHGIGVGIYDIHSPRIPSCEEMEEIALRSLKVIDKSLLWINPDCGLKTRGYEETIPALKNMVKVAIALRERFKNM